LFLSQLATQETDSLGPQIVSVNSIRHLMSPTSGDWSPQEFPLTELEQIEKMEEEMNDPIKQSIYVSTN